MSFGGAFPVVENRLTSATRNTCSSGTEIASPCPGASMTDKRTCLQHTCMSSFACETHCPQTASHLTRADQCLLRRGHQARTSYREDKSVAIPSPPRDPGGARRVPEETGLLRPGADRQPGGSERHQPVSTRITRPAPCSTQNEKATSIRRGRSEPLMKALLGARRDTPTRRA